MKNLFFICKNKTILQIFYLSVRLNKSQLKLFLHGLDVVDVKPTLKKRPHAEV